MYSNLKETAQGTIEYLVALAVIVIISLVVVGLVSSTTNPEQISSSTGKISNLTQGGISIADSVVDVSGDALISLQNSSGEGLTLTQITPVDSSNISCGATNYSTQIVQGESKTFSVDNLSACCPCGANDTTKTCTFKMTYLTVDNLEKTQTTNVTVDCVAAAVPAGEAVFDINGVGTLTHPWLIYSCLELQDMNQHLDGNYALGTNIDCADTINWNDGAGFAPIGAYASHFVGSFNGDDFNITGLYINRPATNYIGLFGYVTGTISNVGLVNSSVSGSGEVGGLVGALFGAVSNSYFIGDVNGINMDLGGLVGKEGDYSERDGISVSGSYTSGRVTGTTVSQNVGGLVGMSYGTISDSYSTANVTASGANTREVAGLVGWSDGAVSNSYATGNVIGGTYTGGLVGQSQSSVTNSYSTGRVTSSGSGSYVAGLIGRLTTSAGGTVSGSYWDTNLTNKSNCYYDGNTGCTSTNDQAALYYGAGGIPFSTLSWSTSTWSALDNNHPILN